MIVLWRLLQWKKFWKHEKGTEIELQNGDSATLDGYFTEKYKWLIASEIRHSSINIGNCDFHKNFEKF